MPLTAFSDDEVILNRQIRSCLEQTVRAVEQDGSIQDDLIQQFRDAVIQAGLGTSENRRAVELIGFGGAVTAARQSYQQVGLITLESGVPFDELLWRLEGIPIPDDIAAQFPELTQQELNAVLRVVTMIISAYSVRVRRENGETGRR